jgi:hypothetical protein
MYCPSCGAESALDLNYCNRCGANMTVPVAANLAPISLTRPALAIGLSVALITLGGFAVLIEGAAKLANVFHVPDPIMAVIMIGMATIMISDIMLIRLLSRIVRSALETTPKANPATLPKPPSRDTPQQLNPQFEPVPSVTEHTTRTFAPIFREPSDRGTQ